MEVIRPYKQTELGAIPQEWAAERINAAAGNSANAIVGGPFGSDLVSADYVASGIPVIRGQNMAATVVSGEFVFVSPQKAKSLSANLAYPGDLVFTQRGTLGQVAIVPDDRHACYLVSQSQMKVTLNRTRHDPWFVHQYFASRAGQKQIGLSAIQTGVPHTNLGILRAYRFPAPPLPEQRSIAKALSDVDALLAGLNRLIAKKRDLKQAAMQQLLTGQTRLPGFKGKWESKRLEDVFRISAGTSKSAFIVENGDYWICDMGSVSTTGKLIVSKRTNYRSDFLARGDLIMPKDDIGGGNIIGKVGYIDANDTYVLSDHIYHLRATEGSSLFLAYVINSHRTNRELRKKVIGSAQLGLGRKSVTEQEIQFPPAEEQGAIATVLSDMDAELTALEARRDKTRALKQAMMQELLTGRTRLVPGAAA